MTEDNTGSNENGQPGPPSSGISGGNTQMAHDLDVEKLRAEIDNLRKERDKFTEEIEDARWNRRSGRYAALATPIVTTLLTLLGIYIGAWQFSKNLSTDTNKFKQQLNQTTSLKNIDLEHDRQMKQQERMHDFLKSFEASQSTTYFALCQAAGTINALPEGDQRNLQAQLKFVQLSQGDAYIVGDDAVINAISSFDSCMNQYGDACSNPNKQPAEMRKRAKLLANACRASMARTSEIDIDKAEDLEKILRPHELPKPILPDN